LNGKLNCGLTSNLLPSPPVHLGVGHQQATISNKSTISNHQGTSRNPQSALANPQFFSVCWK
jgi:hypothetical protein